MSSETEIHPFRVDVPDEAIADLRRRIAATRWPSRELVADRSQGAMAFRVWYPTWGWGRWGSYWHWKSPVWPAIVRTGIGCWRSAP
jgi:hypothetical protein